MQEAGVNLLSIRAINPIKYALSLMDATFSDEEMATHCFASGKRGSKTQLPQEKIKLIEGNLLKRSMQGLIWGRGVLPKSDLLITFLDLLSTPSTLCHF